MCLNFVQSRFLGSHCQWRSYYFFMKCVQVLSKMCPFFGHIVTECVQKFRHILDTFLTHFGHIAGGFPSFQNCPKNVHIMSKKRPGFGYNLDKEYIIGHNFDITWTPLGHDLDTLWVWTYFGHILDIFWTHFGHFGTHFGHILHA